MQKEAIAAVMKKEGLHRHDIPKEANVNPRFLEQIKGSCRYFRCKSSASFDEHIQSDTDTSDSDDEDQCDHSWVSVHAWCVLDLKKQRIAHRWTQECRQCNKKCIPFFDKSSVLRMAEFAVDLCLKRIGRREYEVRDSRYDLSDMEKILTGPHDEDRCEMCQELGHNCWQ